MELDRYVLACYAEAVSKTLHAYERYEFQTISHTIARLLTVDLSAFYIDVSKDALYTLGARSAARRSAQTAVYLMADGLARLLAPLLPVTADELWRHLPGERAESVHLADFPADWAALLDRGLHQRWKRLRGVRDAVNTEIERLRRQKVVGTSLEARVTLRCRGTTAELLAAYESLLPTLFITSEVALETDANVPIDDDQAPPGGWTEPGGGALVEVAPAAGQKCPRCWRYVRQLAPEAGSPGVCERCAEALLEHVGAG